MDRWPLVGRAKPLRQLTAAVLARRGTVITGPAGVGKTTLAMTGVGLAQQRGMSVAHATATRASRGLPFGALASMLPPDSGDVHLPRDDYGDLLRRYRRAVVDAAKGRPLLVFVDDAHLLDDGSATLLHQLALSRTATVLATVRSGEWAPEPVVSLWKDAQADRIEVGALNAAAIEELLVSVLGGPVDDASVRQLIDRCRGNPLFLRELVIGALDADALVEDGGLWRLQADLRPTARLVELVARRLGHLTGPERATLELLTLGEPLEQVELAQLTDPASVDALERKGLIISRPDDRRVQVWLAHPVYGDVVRLGISAIREQRIARSLAEVLCSTGQPHGVLARAEPNQERNESDNDMVEPSQELPPTVTIGDGLTVGAIGYGAMQLTGPKVWGEYPDHDKAIALLREVVAQGVTYIDTADVYGPHSNEELIREALHPYPENLVIATKGGFVRGGPEYSDMSAVGNKQYLRQAAHMSMRRLGLDDIDLYYLHTPTMTDAPFEEIVETLAGMRQDGLIRNIGLSNVSADQLRTALTITDIAAVTVQYNVAVRDGAAVRQIAENKGIVFSPWHPGTVPGGPDSEPFHAVIDPIAQRLNATPQQVGLAWQLHRTRGCLPIPGTTSVEHMKENLAAVALQLTEADVDAITGLRPEDN